MRAHSFAAILVTAPLVLGCAGAAPGKGEQAQVQTASPERQCFSPQQVDNFRTADATTIYLKARPNTVYELTTNGGCNDVDGATRLAILPEVGSRLCSGDWATIAVPGSTQAIQRCRVQIAKVLSAEEVAALPARNRP